MIKHIHHHLHHKTHLPILGVFSVLVGLVMVLAAVVVSFAPNPNHPRYAEAALRETPACNVINTTTSGNISLAPFSTTIAGTFFINLTAFDTASAYNFSATTCVQLIFTSGGISRSWYTNLGDYGTYNSANFTWTVSIPFVSSLLSNGTYNFAVKIFGNNSTAVAQLPYAFNIANYTTTLTTESYSIYTPNNGQVVIYPVNMKVSAPNGLPQPSVFRAKKDSGGAVVLPWARMPSGLSVDYIWSFILPLPPTTGEYAYIACPYDVAASELYLLAPRTNCSNQTVLLTSATSTATTSVTAAPLAPKIYIPNPLNATTLFRLDKVVGLGELGQQIEVQLKYYNSKENVIEPKVFTTTTTATTYPAGSFTFVSPSLAPTAYFISLVSIVNGVRSPATTAVFTIKTPTIVIPTTISTAWSNEIAVDAATQGYVTGVNFFLRSSSSTVDQWLGKASLVSGTPNSWALKADVSSFPNGDYLVIAKAKTVDNHEVASLPVSIRIENSATATDSTTVTDTVTATTTAEPIATADTSADSVAPADTSAVVTDTARTTTDTITVTTDDSTVTDTASVNATNTNQSAVAATNATVTTKKTTAAPTTYVITEPKNDPRRTGDTAPEKMAVEAVTNLETVDQQATALTLTGFGPPNTKITLYIFSSPIVVTTQTDGNGNWTYTLDQPLEDGVHEVYVALTDDTGTVEEKSNPLSFFVAEARAVSATDFQRYQDQVNSSPETYTAYYLVMSALVVVLAVILFLYFRVRARHQRLLAGQ